MKEKAKRDPGPAPDASAATGPSAKLSVNVSAAVGERLRKLAFEERISESSIVEIALQELFNVSPAPELGAFLRERGATLRRG